MPIKPFIPTTEFSSGCLVGEFTCSYKDLVQLFGPPNSAGDEYKVSTEWRITDGEQHFSLYDYNETKPYGSRLPSVKVFRARPSYAWHIGGTVKPDRLIDYLTEAMRVAAGPDANGDMPAVQSEIAFMARLRNVDTSPEIICEPVEIVKLTPHFAYLAKGYSVSEYRTRVDRSLVFSTEHVARQALRPQLQVATDAARTRTEQLAVLLESL